MNLILVHKGNFVNLYAFSSDNRRTVGYASLTELIKKQGKRSPIYNIFNDPMRHSYTVLVTNITKPTTLLTTHPEFFI